MPDDFDDLDSQVTYDGSQETILAGRYRVIRELGRGGMGAVYLAEDQKLRDRKVAIKMPPAVLARNKRAVESMRSEALTAIELTHPHVVTLRAFEETDEAVFLVMDYVDGDTLDRCLVESERLSEAEVLRIFRPVAEALDYAHGQRIVHRDIKPSNIMIATDGKPYIMDFGIARQMKDKMTQVTGRTPSGTLPYMSPEQLMGESPSVAQDIYSLAATMYECLAGHPPFHRGQIDYQIMNREPEPPGPLDSPVVRGIMQALAKEPGQRPNSCAALVGDANTGAPSEPAPRAKEPAPTPEPARSSGGALTQEEAAAHFAAAAAEEAAPETPPAQPDRPEPRKVQPPTVEPAGPSTGPSLIVRTHRKRALGQLIFSLALAGGIVAVALAAVGDEEMRRGLLILAGMIGLGTFFVTIGKILKTAPQVIINAQGIDDLRLKIGVIPWEDIAHLAVYESANQPPMIGIQVADQHKYFSQGARAQGLMLKHDPNTGLPPLAVEFDGLTVEANEALNFIQQHYVADLG